MRNQLTKHIQKKQRFRHHILKSSGNEELFSKQKLKRSIERTGLKPKFCKEIVEKVSKKIVAEAPLPTTNEIYKETIKLIKKQSSVAATHYSLKKSLIELGPTGYEFEVFVSKYFEAIGFETFVDVTMQGQFVTHEVDVIANKPNYSVYTECKFHNNSGRKNDIKIALYVKARWDDLKQGPDGKYLKEFVLASNTAFTSDAITYANGVGLQLLGVNAPEESFLDKIKRYKLYPITSLMRLKKHTVRTLLNQRIVLCIDLLNEEQALMKMGMSVEEIELIFTDINKLLKN